MLEKINKIKKTKLFLEKINKKTKNLDINPNKGGIPANDNKTKTNEDVIKGKLPKNFISLKVFTYFISNTKNIIKTLIKIKIYDKILNNIKVNEYSL